MRAPLALLSARTLVNGGLVALVAVAGWALVSTPDRTSVPAVVTSTDRGSVCLAADPGALCLDGEHVEHLDLAGLSERDCVVVTYGVWVAEGLTRVSPGSCPTV